MLNKKIVLLAHSDGKATDTTDEILSYLLEKNCSDIIQIKFPFMNSSFKNVFLRQYKNGEFFREIKSIIEINNVGGVISYIRDLIYAFFYLIRYCRKSDLVVCNNNLLVIPSILLKYLLGIKKTAFIIIDYTPRRFSNGIVEKVYNAVDKFSLKNSDFVLSLNNEMLMGRIKNSKLKPEIVNHIIMPYGNYSHKYNENDYSQFDCNHIVYFGGLLKSKGVELFVPIIELLIKKGFTNVSFECIGGGDTEYLMQEIQKKKLESHFRVYGIIKENSEIERILLKSAVGLAPYNPNDDNSFSFFADPGKVKTYLGCGLPIVITKVPPISKIIFSETAGLIADYSPEDFANKISIILNSGNYTKYREKAIQLGKEFSWNEILNRTFKRIFIG